MTLLFPASPTVTVPIRGESTQMPIHRIYCVGRNYEDHAKEMGFTGREPPFFFMKPANSIVADGKDMQYPNLSNDVHHEIEMVVAIGKGGVNIPADKALEHVYGYGVGLDMTRRDLQGEAKKMGRPWDTGKAFDQSAPCAAITPAAQFGHPNKGVVKLLVNGEVRQEGNLNQLIWNIPDTIAYLSTLFTLEPGDLIMSGTPAGVGPVKKGDVLEGSVEGLTPLKIKIV